LIIAVERWHAEFAGERNDVSSRQQVGQRFTVLGALLLAACAGGIRFSEPAPVAADSAQIYVYRTARATQNIMPKKVSVDGGESKNLQNGSWMRVVVQPGQHTVSITHHLSSLECKPITLSLGSGETAYIETWTAAGGYPTMVVTCFAEVRTADAAKAAMRGLPSAD